MRISISKSEAKENHGSGRTCCLTQSRTIAPPHREESAKVYHADNYGKYQRDRNDTSNTTQKRACGARKAFPGIQKNVTLMSETTANQFTF